MNKVFPACMHDHVVLHFDFRITGPEFGNQRFLSRPAQEETCFRSFFVAFAILALALATAGTIPTPGSSYQITLSQPSVVNGVDLKAG